VCCIGGLSGPCSRVYSGDSPRAAHRISISRLLTRLSRATWAALRKRDQRRAALCASSRPAKGCSARRRTSGERLDARLRARRPRPGKTSLTMLTEQVRAPAQGLRERVGTTNATMPDKEGPCLRQHRRNGGPSSASPSGAGMRPAAGQGIRDRDARRAVSTAADPGKGKGAEVSMPTDHRMRHDGKMNTTPSTRRASCRPHIDRDAGSESGSLPCGAALRQFR